MNDPYIWVHPGRLSGDPALGGHRLPTHTVAVHYVALGMAETEDAYVIERADVLICCWFEARYGSRKLKRLWREWLGAFERLMWESRWADVPEPPR